MQYNVLLIQPNRHIYLNKGDCNTGRRRIAINSCTLSHAASRYNQKSLLLNLVLNQHSLLEGTSPGTPLGDENES